MTNSISRRVVLHQILVVGGMVYSWPHIGAASSQSADTESSEEPRRFRWRVPKKYQTMVEQSLTFEGTVEPDKQRGFLVIFVGAAWLLYLAKSILRLHDELEGGTLIDVRGKEILIERDRNLPGGVIVIVSNDGPPTLYDRKDLASPADLVSVIQGKK